MESLYISPISRYLQDPTVMFTMMVWGVVVIYMESLSEFVGYFLHPMFLLSFVYLALVIYTTHSTKCVELNDRDFRVAAWFLMNGVYFNLFLDVVSGQFQMMGKMTEKYNVVEPRYALGPYADAGASVFMTSMLELFFQSPMCLLTYYAYHKNRPYRRACEIIVSVLHATGVWYFYIPEVMQDFRHIEGWPNSIWEAFSFHRILFFWFAFWFCGILWVVVPCFIIKTAWTELADIVSDHQNFQKKKD